MDAEIMIHRPFITAHSGCDGTQQDSLDSVQKGIELGADAVEVDVRQAVDGTLILSHDKPAAGAARATLEEAMAMVARAGIGINCDIKETGAIPGVLALAKKLGLPRERLILTGSASPPLLAQNPGWGGEARIWMNMEQLMLWYGGTDAQGMYDDAPLDGDWGELFGGLAARLAQSLAQTAQDCRKMGVEVLNVPHFLPGMDDSIRGLLALGLGVSVWTANTQQDLDRLLALGVTSITTRTTALALQRRAAWAAQNG